MPWSTLIDAETLAANLHARGWVVVDTRFDLAAPAAGRRAWQAGHVPGAVYAHLDEDLAARVRPETGRHPLPDPDALAGWLGRHGIANDTQVVVYDEGPGSIAARLWWLLRWLGHDAVAVLDGGLAAWRAAGQPLDDRGPERAAARFRPRSGSMPTRTTAELADDPTASYLVDARAPERFRGDREPMDPVAGHVPGASNRPLQANLDDSGHFKSPATLRAEWQQELDAAGGRALVSMCGSGVTACHHVLALAHAGIGGVALYAGSWSEWIRDPSRPVARGS